MKNYVKKILSAMIALALILFATPALGETYTEHNESYPADTKLIEAALGTLSLEFYLTEDEEITVRYYTSSSQKIEVTSENGVLTVACSGERPWYDFIGWIFDDDDYGTVEIGVPKELGGALKASLTTGSIDLEGIMLMGNIDAALTTGSLKMTDIVCVGSVNAATTTGSVQIDSARIGGDLAVNTTTGSIRAEQISCDGEARITATTGSVKGEKVTAKALNVQTTTGTIRISKINVKNGVAMSASTGSIHGSVTDSIKNYSIESKTGTGSNNLPSKADYGSKTLKVTTNTGSVDFEFDD